MNEIYVRKRLARWSRRFSRGHIRRVQRPRKERMGDAFIPFPVDEEAEPVSGVREGVQLDHGRVGRRDLPTHIAGDKAVVLPMDEKDRDRCVLHRLRRVCRESR